jgi:DeoR family transcriptional regulator of aga operon
VSVLGKIGSDRVGQAEREALIEQSLLQQRTLTLAEIQRITGASLATVRRDVTRLAGLGLIERTRGGARVVGTPSTLDEEFERRCQRQGREKALIAQAAVDLIDPGSLIFLNDGSTTLSLAHEIVARGVKTSIATSGLNIAELLAQSGALEVLSIGGSLRKTSFGTVGPLAIAGLEVLYASTAFLGCDGLHRKLGVRSNSVEDAHIARAMAAHADTVVVVADSSKLGLAARAAVLDWRGVDILVTDTVSKEFASELQTFGVDLILG